MEDQEEKNQILDTVKSEDEESFIEQENIEFANPENVKNEVDELVEEAEMPLEQLLSKYYVNVPDTTPTSLDANFESSLEDFTSEDEQNIPDNLENGEEAESNYTERHSLKRKASFNDNSRNMKRETISTSSSMIVQTSDIDIIKSENNSEPSVKPSCQSLIPKPKANKNDEDRYYDKYILRRPPPYYLRASAHDFINSDSSSDEDFVPHYWKRKIRVGNQYQADLSVDLNVGTEHEAELLWDPGNIAEIKVDHYLREANKFLLQANEYFGKNDLNVIKDALYEREIIQNEHGGDCDATNTITIKREKTNDIYPVPQDFTAQRRVLKSKLLDNPNNSENFVEPKSELPKKEIVHDNPEALTILMNCLYDVDKAIYRIKYRKALKSTTVEPWTENECDIFETGILNYGKDFFNIQLHMLPDRTVRDLVKFYYFWKRSQRYDLFMVEHGHKRCTSDPGSTDYMERLVDYTNKNINSSFSQPLSSSPSSSLLVEHTETSFETEASSQTDFIPKPYFDQSF